MSGHFSVPDQPHLGSAPTHLPVDSGVPFQPSPGLSVCVWVMLHKCQSLDQAELCLSRLKAACQLDHRPALSLGTCPAITVLYPALVTLLNFAVIYWLTSQQDCGAALQAQCCLTRSELWVESGYCLQVCLAQPAQVLWGWRAPWLLGSSLAAWHRAGARPCLQVAHDLLVWSVQEAGKYN